jgi:formylglycine-generating enzyme required for sulfatase activity
MTIPKINGSDFRPQAINGGAKLKTLTANIPANLTASKITGASAAVKIIIPEMIRIPAGRFTMGSEHQNEGPTRKVILSSAFNIGKYEVTVAEFRAFVNASGYKPEGKGADELCALLTDTTKDRHPVVYVNQQDIASYISWLNKTMGRKFRLPTEAEGEYAARGTDGRIFPWGNEWDPSKLNFNTKGTQPVEAHPEGASPFGVMDLSGNVWEWRADWYAPEYNPSDLIDPKGPQSGITKVLRGGSWSNGSPGVFRATCRNSFHPKSRGNYFSFRLAEDI